MLSKKSFVAGNSRFESKNLPPGFTNRNGFLAVACFVVAILISVLIFPLGITGVLLAAISVLLILNLIKSHPDKSFLQQVFILALLSRVCFAATIYFFNIYSFFGGDANTYNVRAEALIKILWNEPIDAYSIQAASNTSASGWGMYWFVAFIYLITGHNLFAVMMIECVVGAATTILVYRMAMEIYNNQRVAQLSAILVAFFPAMVVWSAQALKDGIIVFLLVLMMLCIIELQKKLNPLYTLLLFLSLFGILSLRFYIFYMAAIAVTGSFLVGTSNTAKQVLQRIIAFAIVGTVLMYIGAVNTANTNFEQYGNLEAVQRSREDLSRSESGYGKNLNVSTTEGAIVALPIGLTYLMLAPFPWEVSNTRQALAIPESIIWWCLMPFLLIGLWYTIRHRWRNAVAILIFTFILTLAYSIFQGNVGTAYRQRTQIQVFLFVFIAVGIVIQREKAENQRFLKR